VYNRPPFPQTDWVHKIQAIVDNRYEIEFPVISGRTDFDDLSDVMKRCLRRDPKQRPTIDELLRHRYVTFGRIDFGAVEKQLTSFVLMVQDSLADYRFDDPSAMDLLEAIAEQFRNGDAIRFPDGI
jgi:serine/threonine protein kinase